MEIIKEHFIQQQYDMIYQYFKNTMPYFDDLEWDGKTLSVVLNDLTIEQYDYNDLKIILQQWYDSDAEFIF